jgi:hypothetical protein
MVKSVHWMGLGIGALALLLVDHYIRIAPLLQRRVIEETEGFQLRAVVPIAASGTIRCGVDLASCPDGLKCANGFCIQPKLVDLKERRPVPVLP